MSIFHTVDRMRLYFSQNQQEEENHVEKQIRDIIKTGEKKLEQHLMRKEWRSQPIRALNRARREQIEGQNRRNTIEMPKSHRNFLFLRFYVKSVLAFLYHCSFQKERKIFCEIVDKWESKNSKFSQHTVSAILLHFC